MNKNLSANNVAIVGLGLIGGTYAKAIKKHLNCRIFASDLDDDVISRAVKEKTIDFKLSQNSLKECDIVIISLYPRATINFVKENYNNFKAGAVIVDTAGVKSGICTELSLECSKKGLYFIGCHPMAGMEKSGYDNSFADMFKGASVVICSDEHTDTANVALITEFYKAIGFGGVAYASPKRHDEIIAFTSQLAHVVSSAYIQSPESANQDKFSGGSYKDMTRVAKLNAVMWTELFMENSTALSNELGGIIERLTEYKSMIDSGNAENLKKMLEKGSEIKSNIG